MTVAELIDELRTLPQGAEIYVPDWEYADGYEPRAPEPDLDAKGKKVRL